MISNFTVCSSHAVQHTWPFHSTITVCRALLFGQVRDVIKGQTDLVSFCCWETMEKSFFTSTAATVGGDISEWIPAVIKKKNSQKLWPLNAPRSGGFFFIPTLLLCITNTQKHNYSNYLRCDDPNQVVQRKAIIIRRGSYKSFISYRGERGVRESSTETGEDVMEVYCTLYMWCIWQTYVKWVFNSNTETWFNLYIHSMLSARPKLMNQRSICCSRRKIAESVILGGK